MNRLANYKNITQVLFSTVLFAFIISLSLLLAHTTTAKILIPLACIAAIFIFIYPKIYFILFFILRPAMDLMAEQEIAAGVNLASIATVFLILVSGIILIRKDNLRKIKENKFLVNVNKIFLCFLLISLVSLINTQDLIVSFADWLRLFSVIIVINYAFVYFGGRENSKTLFLIILISAFLPLCFGLTQYLFKTGSLATADFNRIYGTFVHPNVFAQYLSVVFLITLYFLKTHKTNTALKIVLCLFLMLTAFEIYHTYARGVWIALAVSLTLFSLSYKRTARLAFYLLIFILLFAISSNIKQRFDDVRHSSPYQMGSWQWRVMVWNETKGEIKNHPIIGHGLGMYEKNFSFMAHNDYLRLAYEIGILGLSAYLLYLFYIFFKSTKLLLISRDANVKNRYTLILSLIASLLIMSIADNLARSAVILIYLFCIIGALIGIEVRNKGFVT